MFSIETQFRNFLVESFNLNKDGFKRDNNTKRRPVHLRISKRSGISSIKDFLSKIDQLGLKVNQTPSGSYSGSPDYKDNGFIIHWNNKNIAVLIAIQQNGNVQRKEYTPTSLGLMHNYNSALDLFKDVSTALAGDSNANDLLLLMNNVKNKKPVTKFSNLNENHMSRITSDFGEVLVAYKSLIDGYSWKFTTTKNSPGIDGYRNGKPVSIKNPKGGGKVNLKNNKNKIDKNLSATNKWLWALANHEKDLIIQTSIDLVPGLREYIPGTDKKSLVNFVLTTDYDLFYNTIGFNYNGLGIPNLEEEAKLLWQKGDLEPLYFTILTLVNRFWGQTESVKKEITQCVSTFLIRPIFIQVDFKNGNVVFKEQLFKKVNNWQTVYWGRAVAAFHNWPAIEPAKGI
jgi:hypothetical protein